MADATDLGPAELPALRLDFGAPGARILHPEAADYAALARDLAGRLAALGLRPTVLVETDATALASAGPLLVLGNAMSSRRVRRLYHEAYDFTDLAFPGPGGFTLRTIRDPFGHGAPVVLVGGSDLAGVREAVERLVQRIRRDGPVAGFFNEVRLGCWATAEELEPARLLADHDATWQRVGESGSWEYMERIARCATGYLRTADERYLDLFRREFLRFIAHDLHAPNPEAPVMLHGRMHMLVTAWDLVRDHPKFSTVDRREFDAALLEMARSAEGVAQIRAVAATTAVRFNHDTRAGLDAFFLGRYFDRRHRLPEAREWLEVAAQLFAPQLGSAKPAEDSWGHQWAASLHNTLVYALAAGRTDYLESSALRRAAERALVAHGAGGPRDYLALCALATGDSGYLCLEPDGETFVRRAAQLRLGLSLDPKRPSYFEEVLRSFATTTEIRRRPDLLGLAVAPLDPLWYRTIESPVYNPGGIFAVTVPEAAGFDKLALRDGWGPGDFHLLLDGISGGHHAYQDANCLVGLREGGVEWFTTATGYDRPLSVRAQNGVQATFDGAGPGRIHRYARLAYRGAAGEFTASGTVLEGVGASRWERQVLRRRGAWTLVLDRVTTSTAGELLVERFWHPAGEETLRQDGFSCTQVAADGEAHLHLQSAMIGQGELSRSGRALVERVRLAAAAGDGLVMAALIWVNRDPAPARWRLAMTDHGWKVIGPGEAATDIQLNVANGAGCGLTINAGDRTFVIGAPASAGAIVTGSARPLRPEFPSLSLPLRPVATLAAPITAVAGRGGHWVAGSAAGEVVRGDGRGVVGPRLQVGGPVRALELTGDAVIVGDEHGTVSRLLADGSPAWVEKIPWVTIPWAYWSEGRSCIREIAVADMDGDGEEEIFVSNADRRVYAFDRSGRRRWKHPVEWGVFTAMCPGRHQGRFALLGGTARPSIHGFVKLLGADGRVLAHLQRPDLVCWSLPSSLRDMRQVDLDGDGRRTTLAAVNTNCRQLIAYAEDGSVHWEHDLAAGVSALALDEATRRVYAASEAGFVAAVDGPSGKRRWTVWLGEAVDLLWVRPDQSLLAIATSGTGWIIAANGTVRGRGELGAAITALPRPGDHRDASRPLVLGTADGRVLM